MEIIIDRAYIANVVGSETLEKYLNLVDISDTILWYLVPWIATIALVTNMLVAVLCPIIYLKTKKKNHKPAFVFIGFLAIIDVLLGGFLLGTPHHHHHYEEEITNCKLRSLCGIFVHSLSHFAILALTCDRLISIRHPLHYPLIMTQTKTWLMILVTVMLATMVSLGGAFTFQLPHDEVCTFTNTYPGWFILGITAIYCFLLLLMCIVYIIILMQFRQLRKRLEAMKKEFTINLVFKKNNRIISPKSKSEVPGIYNNQIQSISMEMIETEKCFYEERNWKHFTRRRSSSVARSLSVLLSHARAANYVLIIVAIYLAMGTPFSVFCLLYSSPHDSKHLHSHHVNVTDLKTCFKNALQDQHCNIFSEYRNEINQDLQSILHSFESDTLFHTLGPYLTQLNSIANPVLYAFWYPDFRKYVFQIFSRFTKIIGK